MSLATCLRAPAVRDFAPVAEMRIERLVQGWCQGRNRVSPLRCSKVANFWASRPGPYQQKYHHDVLMCGLDSVRVRIPMMADAGYGTGTDFRDGITEAGLADVVGIQSSTSLWPPGLEPLPPKTWRGRWRRTSAIRRDSEHHPISARQLALELPQKAWRRGHLARGEQRHARLTFRCRAGPPRASPLSLLEAQTQGMVPDRMARGRYRPDEMFSVNAAREHQPLRPRQHCQAALADRARLPGSQAGTWPRSLREARMARLPSSCHAVHRCLRVPDLREGSASRLRITQRPFLVEEPRLPDACRPCGYPRAT